MEPNQRINNRLKHMPSLKIIWEKMKERYHEKKPQTIEHSLIKEPLAIDATAQRLLGCAFIQTEIPKMMQCKVMANFLFRIRATFLTRANLYAFYYQSATNATLKLARMCRFSQTWEQMKGFSLQLEEEKILQHILPLPWTRNKQVLLFCENSLRLLRMDLPEGIQMSSVNLTTMIFFPEFMEDYEEKDVFVNWMAVTTDDEDPGLYVLAEVSARQYQDKELGVYRLDWPSKSWVKLPLRETETQKLVRGDFLFHHGSFLTIGLVERRLHPEESNIVDKNDFEMACALTKVIRINLHNFTWFFIAIEGQPDQWTLDHQVTFKFTQMGCKAFCLSAVATVVDGYMTVVKNQLWVLDLNTLILSKINDGPVGTVRTIEPVSVKVVTERAERKLAKEVGDENILEKVFFSNRGIVVGNMGSNGEIAVPYKAAYILPMRITPLVNHLAEERSARLQNMFVVEIEQLQNENEAENDNNDINNSDEDNSDEDSNNDDNDDDDDNNSSRIRAVSTMSVSKLLMRHFFLSVGTDRRELWAVSTRPLYFPNERIDMYRIPLWGVSRLTSLALESVLFRAPCKALVVQSMRCSHNRLVDRVCNKQKRTLEHISRFFKTARIPLQRLLPSSLPPILRVIPPSMAASFGNGGENLARAVAAAASTGRMPLGSIHFAVPDLNGGAAQLLQFGNDNRPLRLNDESRAAAAALQILPSPRKPLAVMSPAIPLQFQPLTEQQQQQQQSSLPASSAAVAHDYQLSQQQRFFITRELANIEGEVSEDDEEEEEVIQSSESLSAQNKCPHHCSMVPFVIYRCNVPKNTLTPVAPVEPSPFFPCSHILQPNASPQAPAQGVIPEHLARDIHQAGSSTQSDSARTSSTVPSLTSNQSGSILPPPPELPTLGFVSQPSNSAPNANRTAAPAASEAQPAAFAPAPLPDFPSLVTSAVYNNDEASPSLAQLPAEEPPSFALDSCFADYSHFEPMTPTPSPFQSAFSAATQINQADSSRAIAELELPANERKIKAMVEGRPAVVIAEVRTPLHYAPIRVEGLTPERFRIRQLDEIIINDPSPHVLSPTMDGNLGIPIIHVRVQLQNAKAESQLYGMSVPIP